MITLYEWPPTRSQRVRWVLEELELPHKSERVDLSGDQHTEAYRRVHPLGAVPAVRTEAYSIFESVAIVLQLIDEHSEMRLAPALGSPERAYYYQWCVFAGTELDPAIMTVFDNTMRPLDAMRPPGTPHDPALADRGRDDFALRAQAVSEVLRKRDYLLGSEFSGADILVGHSCFMATVTGLIDGYPELQAYHARLQARPAYQRAYAVVDEMRA